MRPPMCGCGHSILYRRRGGGTMTDLFPVSLPEQVACVKREIAMRERAYPRFVDRGTMPQKKADREIAMMRAVLATLEKLKGESQ